MPSSGLETVQRAADDAVKQLDADLRRMNRSANEARADVKHAKAEYEVLVAQIDAAKQELAVLTKKSGAIRADLDAHRQTQIGLIEKRSEALDLQAKQLAVAADRSATQEQQAHAALSDFKEARGKFLARVQTFRQAIEKAIADLSA